ncbi:MAG: tRNA uracil 4-sulfurtransferase ThiI [Acidobacteriota bacterium]
MQTSTLVLGYSGELSVKAKGTRNRFAERLVRNLNDALKSAGVPYELRRTWSRIYIDSPSERALEVVRRVFGVHSVVVAERRPWRELDDVLRDGEAIFTPQVAGKTFAVRVRRGGRGQHQPFKSPEVERRLGARLVAGAAGVDLKHPEVTARVELRRDQAYYSSRSLVAEGGLPVGTEGRALALISGGFDSGVAAWLLLRRGVMLDYLFCNLAGDAHRDAVLEVVKVLADSWSYGSRPRLHIVDFRPLVEEIQEHCPAPLWQVLLKRQMLRAADAVARISRSTAIVTGEAVGQVSSQTLQNLAVISAATEIPILRPLVASHKEEIVDLARRIGTYDLSARVPEHCMLVPRNPETHAKPSRVERAEEKLDPTKLEAQIQHLAVLDLRALALDKASAPELETEAIPLQATVLDLRSPLAFKSWHYPGALRIDYVEALEIYPSFERDAEYVLYCEVGLKSAHLASVMHEAGYRARHVAGGLTGVLRLGQPQDPALQALLAPAVRDSAGRD